MKKERDGEEKMMMMKGKRDSGSCNRAILSLEVAKRNPPRQIPKPRKSTLADGGACRGGARVRLGRKWAVSARGVEVLLFCTGDFTQH